jgi:DNA-binding NarL/FixJ family response regulator
VQQPLANRMPSSDLSTREAEILDSIMKGLTNKDIAAKLNITVGT